ncbi:MAG: FAD-dependent oxidoreductase [Rhodothermales bacterium]|nr:FAD-dependent oxidoreductase [Rhodothermales bacterium]
MDERFDCIIVGGGIAGLSAAMILAKANRRFLLIERGEFCGAKNVSGGVLWGRDLHRLVPEYWKQDAGIERVIAHRRLTFMDDQSAFSVDFKSDHFREPPYPGLSVLRARFDEWLAAQVQDAIDRSDCADESFLATNVLVDSVLVEDGRVVGIQAGDEQFRADVVILAEGVNNLLTRQVGIEDEYVPADHVAVGVKEVIGLDQKVLEDRFQLSDDSGLSNEFVGYATRGVEGGGFLYTNRSSLSVGLVLGMKDLQDKKLKPYDLLNDFKAHPVVRDMLAGGEVLEYSAHVVSTGDLKGVPEKLYGDGLLVAGEAAHLLLNAGKAIQGMDYAMRSGILAAETVIESCDKGDHSADALAGYQRRLEESYVMKDMRGFQGAVHLLHDPMMFGTVPSVICDFGRSFFTVDSKPTPKTSQMLKDSVRKHGSMWQMIKLATRAARNL